MSEHLLVKHSTRKKYSEIPELPKGAEYDTERGYWTIAGGPLVLSDEFINDPVSKKCDQETGEDQKGE